MLKKWWEKFRRGLGIAAIAITLLSMGSCASSNAKTTLPARGNSNIVTAENITEVSPPEAIQVLRRDLELYQPQVTIVSPEIDEVIQDDKVEVSLQVRDLPVFKDTELELGPHLHFILDNQPYKAIYDPTKPLTLSELEPGTHTLRVFAASPWHESFKNAGAYAQTTFHIFTKTQNNNPDPALPLLTYSRPQGEYGAEPILLDFYLTNAPLHLANTENNLADWRIRCTINGQSFVLDRWQSIYLKGFKPGKNWIQLEFIDGQGNSIKNVFNNTLRVITYESKGKDTLSKLVTGELSAKAARGIIDQNYAGTIPPEPIPIPTETPRTTLEDSPTPTETPFPVPTPETSTTPEDSPTPTETLSPVPTPENLTNEVKPSQSQKLKNYFNRLRHTNTKTAPDSSPPEITNPPVESPSSNLESETPVTELEVN